MITAMAFVKSEAPLTFIAHWHSMILIYNLFFCMLSLKAIQKLTHTSLDFQIPPIYDEMAIAGALHHH